MLRKYNIAVSIVFWMLIISIALVVTLALTTPKLNLFSYLIGKKTEVIVQKEPYLITEYKEIEKKVEWYYFIATGYSKNDISQGTTDITATGKVAVEGIIAVDPKIIPFGTTVEIKDIGVFIADDRGGKIKGDRIDIFFDSKEEAKDFGKKGVWLRFLENGKGIEIADEITK
ncbi:MAG: 3D domain-containing protein [Actinobacteria bacterium]|nr:3D domain-containing protein [Actinomycetota bacterium]